MDWIHFAFFRIGETLADLSLVARDLVRALAIGLYGTFVVLSLMVIRRGGPAKAALFWVTILFLLMIGPGDMPSESNARWAFALALAGVGSLMMTNRLQRQALAPPTY